MGEHRHIGDSALLLIDDVAAAAALSNTRRILADRVKEALSRHLPLADFALHWPVAHEKQLHINEPTGDDRVIVIPLRGPDGLLGYARISLSVDSETNLLTPALLQALGGLLSFAQHHCLLIERIAKLSSSAQHESQGLRNELLRFTDPNRLVARSASMRHVLESADLVANHDTAVLLRGDTGTGKELLARRIHHLSRRSRHPFVAVNCGALPESLAESELFGHEKGAFTGAIGRYRGRFERANNGTIFLDEVADLPMPAQVKLLRVLQEGEFERLGGEETVRVNVRVIAATHRGLESMMAEGTFREDLFYRLNVFPIVIPPLRDRPEDIPMLARTLLAEMSKRLGCALPVVNAREMAKLLAAPWPGNVRELGNSLERALILSQGRALEFRELRAAATERPTAPDSAESFNDGSRRTIQMALDACGGRIYGKKGAAARLQIPPSTLQGKMKRLGIKNRQT